MDEQKKVVCSKCGKELWIPQKLREYSCIYCGARERELPQNADFSESAEQISEKLIDCVRNYPDYPKRITRDFFEPSFETYEKECAPVFYALDEAYRQQGETVVSLAVERFLQDLEARWEKNKNQSMNDKMVVAVFLVPMVRKQKLDVSEPFCSLLQKTWVARYPKNPFFLGSYEDICAGFRKKLFNFCFITTAVCRHSGLADDCAELTAFRAFRDGYLRSCEDGEALISEYYNVAPGIVTCIDLTTDSEKTYAQIRRNYLTPCYEDLLAGRLQSCKNRYVKMVRDLQKEFFSS